MGWFLGCFKCVQKDQSKKEAPRLVKNKSRSDYFRSLSCSLSKSGNPNEDTISVSIKPQETGSLPVKGRVNDQEKHINVNLSEASNLVREVKCLQTYETESGTIGKDSESSQMLNVHYTDCSSHRTNDATSGASDKDTEKCQCRNIKVCEIEALDTNSFSGTSHRSGVTSLECCNTSDAKTTSCESIEATTVSNCGSCLDSDMCCSTNCSPQSSSVNEGKRDTPQQQGDQTGTKTGMHASDLSNVEPKNIMTSEDKSLSLSSLSNDSSCLSSTHSVYRLKDGSCISLNSVMTISIPSLVHSNIIASISSEDYAYSQQNSSTKPSDSSNIEEPFLSPNSVISKQQMSPSRTPSDCSSNITTPNSISKKKSPAQLADERPILGTVAAHWNHSSSTTSRNWFDGKGIPNSTNKYKEDQKVNWHTTPFEVRLERALAKQGSTLNCWQKHPLKKQLFVEPESLHEEEIVGCRM